MQIARGVRVASLLVGVTSAGCDEEVQVGEVTAEIVQEVPGAVEVVARRYGTAAIAKVSYAAAEAGGCSAMMIGPSTLMSAAHCGIPETVSINFRVYRDGLVGSPSVRSFTCRFLYQTFDDTDLVLYDCPPLPPPPIVPPGWTPAPTAGEAMGYVDFSTGSPALDQEVYSIWQNPVDDGDGVPETGEGQHMLYSPGVVTNTAEPGWWVPDGHGDIGTATSTWTDYGGSGSTQLDAVTHKILIGPLSTGTPDGPGREALSASNFFSYAEVSTEEPCSGCPTMNTAYIDDTLGLNPLNYYGLVDETSNRLFDIQSDIESLRGESWRRAYWLGFESPRRNQHWARGPMTVINAGAAIASLRMNTVAPLELLAHRKLRGVAAAGAYRVRLSIDTQIAGSGATLTLALRQNGVTRASVPIPLSVPGGYTTHTLVVSPTQPVNQLALIGTGNLDVLVRDISVHLPTVTLLNRTYGNAFDLADERSMWRNGNNGGVAPILPDGESASASIIDFAGHVEKAPSASSTNNFPLESAHLPLVVGRQHRICWRHERASGSAFEPTTPWGLMQVRSGTTVVTSASFTPGSAWASTCSGWFTPSTGGMSVRFGTYWGSTFHAGKYNLDRLAVETTDP